MTFQRVLPFLLLALGHQVQAQPGRFEATPFWSDEFSIDGPPDPKRWGFNLGGHGWGNQELQFYTARPENARVQDGKLILEARKEDYQGCAYTSARLVTKDRCDFVYGKVVVRAKLPKGRGTWPAIWMLASQHEFGKDYWPDNGEIDIMEHVGFEPGKIHASIHSKSFNHLAKTQKTAQLMVDDASEAFHDYSLEWTPETIRVTVDEKAYFEFHNPGKSWQEWPFDEPFHLLLNVAVGGFWGGMQGVDESIWPQRMEVDFVRIYHVRQE